MIAKLKALIAKYDQFLRFCIVGVANTAITVGLFYLLDKWRVQYLVASVIAYGAGILNGFFWSTRKVFKTRGNAVNFTKFVIVNIAAIGLNLLLMYVFVDVAGIQPKVLAQVFVVPFTTVVNFTLNKFWTFSGKKDERAGRE